MCAACIFSVLAIYSFGQQLRRFDTAFVFGLRMEVCHSCIPCVATGAPSSCCARHERSLVCVEKGWDFDLSKPYSWITGGLLQPFSLCHDWCSLSCFKADWLVTA